MTLNVTAFAANQRDEVRLLGSVSGSVQANPGMKQQTFLLFEYTPPHTYGLSRVMD